MTTTEHKKALRKTFMHMAGAIQAENWQAVYDDVLEIQHQARCLLLDEIEQAMNEIERAKTMTEKEPP